MDIQGALKDIDGYPNIIHGHGGPRLTNVGKWRLVWDPLGVEGYGLCVRVSNLLAA